MKVRSPDRVELADQSPKGPERFRPSLQYEAANRAADAIARKFKQSIPGEATGFKIIEAYKEFAGSPDGYLQCELFQQMRNGDAPNSRAAALRFLKFSFADVRTWLPREFVAFLRRENNYLKPIAAAVVDNLCEEFGIYGEKRPRAANFTAFSAGSEEAREVEQILEKLAEPDFHDDPDATKYVYRLGGLYQLHVEPPSQDPEHSALYARILQASGEPIVSGLMSTPGRLRYSEAAADFYIWFDQMVRTKPFPYMMAFFLAYEITDGLDFPDMSTAVKRMFPNEKDLYEFSDVHAASDHDSKFMSTMLSVDPDFFTTNREEVINAMGAILGHWTIFNRRASAESNAVAAREAELEKAA